MCEDHSGFISPTVSTTSSFQSTVSHQPQTQFTQKDSKTEPTSFFRVCLSHSASSPLNPRHQHTILLEQLQSTELDEFDTNTDPIFPTNEESDEVISIMRDNMMRRWRIEDTEFARDFPNRTQSSPSSSFQPNEQTRRKKKKSEMIQKQLKEAKQFKKQFRIWVRKE